MINLKQYSDDELSLRIFNEEWLYNIRHTKGFLMTIKQLYTYTRKQLAVLKQDLIDDKKEVQ